MNYHKNKCALYRFFAMEYETDFYIFLIHLLNLVINANSLWLVYNSLILYKTGLLGEASETNGAN